MTEDGFRRVALGMPGAIEGAHMGHPDFRLNGRIFASLHGNGETGMVKLTPEEQAAVMRDGPEMFTPSSGAWGRQGSTNVRLAVVTESALRGAMLLAWEQAGAANAARATR
jgi:hypothetical protein